VSVPAIVEWSKKVSVPAIVEYKGPFIQPFRLSVATCRVSDLYTHDYASRLTNVSADEVLCEAQTLYDRWPKLPTEDKRKIAESIVEKIVIGDGEIDITLSCLPASE
jgi:hypothetical protein